MPLRIEPTGPPNPSRLLKTSPVTAPTATTGSANRCNFDHSRLCFSRKASKFEPLDSINSSNWSTVWGSRASEPRSIACSHSSSYARLASAQKGPRSQSSASILGKHRTIWYRRRTQSLLRLDCGGKARAFCSIANLHRAESTIPLVGFWPPNKQAWLEYLSDSLSQAPIQR